MGRSGYTEDCDNDWQLIMWRGAVASSIRGKRGQAFLRELVQVLDDMPEKRLIRGELRKDGGVCALGSIGAKRGIDLESLDPYDYDTLANVFGVAKPLIQELEWMNDECVYSGDSLEERRWQQMRQWALNNLKPEASP